MAISTEQIHDEEVNQLLDLEESHFAEIKSRDITPGKLTRTIAAFANAGGGELLVGIEESNASYGRARSWNGFPNIEAANGHIQVFERLFPLGQYYQYAFISAPGRAGLVLQVLVQKTREIIKASDGVVYVRRGAQNLPFHTADELARLRLDKGLASFETETVDTAVEVVTNAGEMQRFIERVVPRVDAYSWLRKQQLMRGDKPTVAAVLLFADEPQAILPKRSGVKIYRYRTSADAGARETLAFDPISIEGPLYQQVASAVTKTTELVEGIQKLGPRGLEAISYPPETLHEIVTNALLHRDYSIPVDVHIRIFDNRLEVESPGRLPGHITTRNILDEQFARNGTIVRIINKFPDPPNKDVGEGLNTAFAAMSKLRLKPPLIDERENSVLVRIRHEALASPEEAVMEYLETHDEIVNRIGREITGIASENSMKNVFYRLRDRQLIEPVPGRIGFGAAWRKASK